MAHGIIEGLDSMFSVKTPWHTDETGIIGTGKTLRKQPALKRSGLNWEVELQPTYMQTPNGPIEIMNQQGVWRTDVEGPAGCLGTVGSDYRPMQNKDAFEFMEALCGEGGADFWSAGSLWGGKKIWLLAKMPEAVSILGSDKIEQYILLANSHDGSSSLKAGITPIRVVCNNTMTAALRDLKREWAVRHVGQIGKRVVEAQITLGLAKSWMEVFAEEAEVLAAEEFGMDRMEKLVNALWPYDKRKERQPKQQRIVLHAFESEETCIKPAPNTRWAAFQAVSLFTDHAAKNRVEREAIIRSGSDEQARRDARMNSAVWGPGRLVKEKAWKMLTGQEKMAAA